jgi:phosphoacetylglucosamine mutase
VVVADKSQLRCSEDEKRLVAPSTLQTELDIAMQAVTQGRCFVRPSGTEDVVRIYAEAASVEEVDKLIQAGKAILLRHCSV